MKAFYFLFLLIFSFGISAKSQQSNFESRNIQILPGSSLSISGNTNINVFECDFNTLYFKDQNITVNFSEKGEVFNFQNSVLPLENEKFDCGNRRINKDFKDLLKTEKHPEILLKIKEIDMNRKEKAKVTLNFQIAGVEKNYTFPVQVTREDRELCFNGKLKLNIKDFNLEAPSKMFGLIVIEEEIVINFNLNILAEEDERS